MMEYIWLGVLVLMVVVEIMTTQLVSTWFAVGAFGAFLTALFGGELWVQIVVFTVVSAIALIITRPLVKKLTKNKTVPTNADMVIGKTGIVTEKIDNIAETGLVKAGGSVWTARSGDNTVIETGERVTVLEIKGVKLIVTRIKDESVNNL